MKPGLYPDLSVEAYHADPCEEPSLSSSGIRTLLNETPAHFAARHPKLTRWPEYVHESTKEQDLGTVIHRLVLGRGGQYVVIDPSSYRNKDGSVATTFANAQAKAAKQAAEAQGLVVLDNASYSQADLIASNVTRELTARYGGWPLGESEVTGIWRRDTEYGPIWCRMLIDLLSLRMVTAFDVKSTRLTLGRDELARRIAGAGGDIQAAWYLEGLTALFPEHAGLWQFIFVYAETEPPFDVLPVKLNEGWLTRARHRIDRACNKFAYCLRENAWPGWGSSSPLALSAPSYLETKWQNEELEERHEDA